VNGLARYYFENSQERPLEEVEASLVFQGRGHEVRDDDCSVTAVESRGSAREGPGLLHRLSQGLRRQRLVGDGDEGLRGNPGIRELNRVILMYEGEDAALGVSIQRSGARTPGSEGCQELPLRDRRRSGAEEFNAVGACEAVVRHGLILMAT
jgi:hypothetical protein